MNITTHKINTLNSGITIEPSDPNAAGVPRKYIVTLAPGLVTTIEFHEGDPSQGANGLTQEVLMAILEHRLMAWQGTAYNTREAQIAIGKLQECRLWLGERTRLRIEREVEGTPSP